MSLRNYEARPMAMRRSSRPSNREARHAARVPQHRSHILVGERAIASAMFNDPTMNEVVRHLAETGQLGHHYRGRVLCATRMACALCLRRIHDEIEGTGVTNG